MTRDAVGFGETCDEGTSFPVLFEYVRRGSNSQPSVPKFEEDRFRNSRRNHEIDR